MSSKPSVQTQVEKSKDGKYILHKTVITDIKPITYFHKVIMSNTEKTEKDGEASP